MLAVIFEAEARPGHQQDYLDLAAELRSLLDGQQGFISVERFQSLQTPGKVLSLSFWQDEASILAWRQQQAHRHAQAAGRAQLFHDYRLRVAQVLRDYGLHERSQAPADCLQPRSENQHA
ncbi:antibiotic biosynthesis monooxygenase [Pseudomonas sp. UL073]|uniref:Antibiotic biosynthesis monooxygenase n=1 Tax=Zestomonas insulae TaxID=2809017 RepID=A0ABS2IHF9_9GAMM|nr:antibiotic biosynthesis monooxygenase [Pseudomonas insulae]MBM7062500.1 antibiotic biosynthesis monooxygenase [Pseudomonas insulae]